ncbi:T9SS type A sorting domain-containing protein [bacterium]|nr:T9SS type A sorting domain-containing protein [bacterium]
MKRIFWHSRWFMLVNLVLLLMNSTIFSQIHISGEISGVLEDTLYIIDDDITLRGFDTLTISGGAELEFMPDTYFAIYGRLITDGAEGDTIRFRSHLADSTWRGINFRTGGRGDFNYCLIRDAHIGIQGWMGGEIRNCVFIYNDGAMGSAADRIYDSIVRHNRQGINANGTEEFPDSVINCDASYNRDYGINASGAIIKNCIISYNGSDPEVDGVGISASSHTVVDSCMIFQNRCSRGGVYLSNGSTIKNSMIFANQGEIGGGITTHLSGCLVDKCTIIGNNVISHLSIGSGVWMEGYNDVLTNSIVAYNTGYLTNGVDHHYVREENIVTYNLIYGNDNRQYRQMDTTEYYLYRNLNETPCDSLFNIYLDPRLLDIENNIFELTADSPCIDAGDPDHLYDPDNTITDIGYHYYPHESIVKKSNLENQIVSIFDVYPNPFNQNLKVNILTDDLLPDAELKIYDLLGRQLISAKINNPRQSYNFEGFCSGTYFIRVTQGNYQESRTVYHIK